MQLLANSLDLRDERGRDLGIELRAGKVLDLRDRHLVWHGAPVSAITRHGIVRVGYGDNARNQRDLLLLDSERVAATIPTLVVQINARNHRFQKLDRVKDV